MRAETQGRTRHLPRLGARLGLAALLAALLLGGSAAKAAVGPVYDIRTTWGDTNLPSGGKGQFQLQVRNVGDAVAEEELTITEQLPAGVTATAVHWDYNFTANISHFCKGAGTGVITCKVSGKDLVAFDPTPGIPGDPTVALGAPYPAEGAFPGFGGYLPQVFIDVKVAKGAAGVNTNTATVSGGGAAKPTSDVDQVPFSATPAGFGIVAGSFAADVFTDAYPLGEPARQAGDRPYEYRFNGELIQLSDIALDGTRYLRSKGFVRTVEATLPRGMIGNPEATPKCDPDDFLEKGASKNSTGCPPETQVGYLNAPIVTATENFGRGALFNPNAFAAKVPIYNLKPPKGVPADFAFNVFDSVQGHIYPQLDPVQDYAIKTLTPNISAAGGVQARSFEVTIWGVPGDPAHDKFRHYPQLTEGKVVGASYGGAPIRPLLTNPTDCGEENGGSLIRVESYEAPGVLTPVQESGEPLDVEGCDDPRFRFEPQVELLPTSRAAGGPTGLDVTLKVPQRDDAVKDAKELYAKNGDVQAIATPPIKKAVVTLPDGMTVSPSAAQGLGSCSPSQIGLRTNDPVTCPDNSQYGTLTLKTPILPEGEVTGRLYVAEQFNNPFGSFLALYLAIQEPERGILVKIPGRVDLDPATGQITTTFDDIPQFPMSSMQMKLKGGVRAALVNPQTCGRKTITAAFYSWHDPNTPITKTSSYEVAHSPDGSPCFASLAQRPFDPLFSAGTVNPLAGAFSPLAIRLTRTDTNQELAAVEAAAPPGLTASLRGIGRCSEAQIKAAEALGKTGKEELAAPSCPASTQVGTVEAGAGVGQVLTYVTGKVYLAGTYKGAPLSGVVITPAVAGPFDLGVIVVRAPAYIDPKTARVRLVSDPLPQIFKGIPVRVRDIRVHLDRPNFTLNPTNCSELSFTGTIFGINGATKDASNRFQLGDCASLGFRPRLSLRLRGGTKRGFHPALRAVLKAPEGDANVARASVTLPRSALFDQAHIRTVCTRVQFAAHNCPRGAIYGKAVAHSPLLEEPLRGPVYLRSSDNLLPDLVLDLKGLVDVEAAARVDSVRGGIRTIFPAIPDAPLSKVIVHLQGGRKGLLVNSRNLCARPSRAVVRFGAHSGRRHALRPRVKAPCGKGRKGKKRDKRIALRSARDVKSHLEKNR